MGNALGNVLRNLQNLLNRTMASNGVRTIRRRRAAAVLLVISVLPAFGGLGAAAQSAEGETFKTRLSWLPIGSSGDNRANIAGVGTASAVLDGSRLAVTGTFEGLTSPATEARLHEGLAAGVRGPVLFELTISKATAGNVSGTFDLTPEQVENLKKGRFYLQIHSESAPDGNLWGWLLP